MATIKDTGKAYDLYLTALEVRILTRLAEARCVSVDEELEHLLRSGILVMDETGENDIFFQYSGEESPEELLKYPDFSGGSTSFPKNSKKTDAVISTLDALYTEAWSRGYFLSKSVQDPRPDVQLGIKRNAIKAALFSILRTYDQEAAKEVILTHVQQRISEDEAPAL